LAFDQFVVSCQSEKERGMERHIVFPSHISRVSRLVFVFLLIAGLSTVSPPITRAASTWFVATTGNDVNNCLAPSTPCKTIQAAVVKAANGDSINIAAGTYAQGANIRDKNLDLNGAGATSTIVDGAGIFILRASASISGITIQRTSSGAVSTVNSTVTLRDSVIRTSTTCAADNCRGAVSNIGTMTIINTTVADNFSPNILSAARGGGIYNDGTLTLIDSRVSGNTAESGSDRGGGGIFNERGSVTITNSVIEGNFAKNAHGGGIYNAANITIINSVVHGNSAGISGGGISNTSNGTLTVENTIISGNSSVGNGGGIAALGGTIAFTNSTISGNNATGNGGGIDNFRGTADLKNSTISGNTSAQEGGGIGNGGTVTLVSSTITSNTADLQGGGVVNYTSMTLRNTILAANSQPAASPDCVGTLTSVGYNLVGNNTGCSFTPTTGDKVGTSSSPINPRLGPLQDNGGSSPTHALLLGSPALDAGNPTTPGSGGNACPSTDQRGIPRPQGRACDIGSYEHNESSVSTDIIADRLEVTQAIQDLNNSVRLVAGKRTFVRFHVHSTTRENRWTYAELRVSRGGNELRLKPINPGNHITVVQTPNRGLLDHAFLFELPSDYTAAGELSLIGVVNPITDWGNRIAEMGYDNNNISARVLFEQVPPVNLVIYGVAYGSKRQIYPAQYHLDQLHNWLQQAYPLSDLNVKYGRLPYKNKFPACEKVNGILAVYLYYYSLAHPFRHARFYGMVDDTGGFMRGCAASSTSNTASGPTGVPGANSWDSDGSYGDWYGGHELGHIYERRHIRCTGDEKKPDRNFPYTTNINGRISPALTGDTAIYGFNIGTQDIYGPDWTDVMTYCDNQWVSDYTYHGLMNYFQDNLRLATTSQRALADRLLVIGSIDLTNNQVELEPLFVIPNANDSKVRVPGNYTITLRSPSGTILARYPFTPDQTDDLDTMVISELVPYVAGTTQVDIEGLGGILLHRVRAGAAHPTVTVTAPNGGETLTSNSVTVSWTANDPDGDPLAFNVQYSPDNGVTWEMVAQDITENSVEIDTRNITAGQQARVRVWVSDGIHTASDESDAPFLVPNRIPTAEISAPSKNITIVAGETLGLVGKAYDVDTGTMDDSQLQWLSSIDGLLGTGEQVSTASLSVGTHIITFRADDGRGGLASDTVSVTVVSNPTEAPPVADKLFAGPEVIIFDPAQDVTSVRLSIGNQNGPNNISWNALADAPWLRLSGTSGATPADVIVSIDKTYLPSSSQTATITLTSPNTPGASAIVRVIVREPPYQLWLPLVR
jgi:hypothetical protein